ARLGWDPAEDTYQAACALARCAAVTASATSLPEAERNTRAQSYAARALALLRQAVAHGYRDVAQLKPDKDLGALRPRSDFQQLVRELEERASPGARCGWFKAWSLPPPRAGRLSELPDKTHTDPKRKRGKSKPRLRFGSVFPTLQGDCLPAWAWG